MSKVDLEELEYWRIKQFALFHEDGSVRFIMANDWEIRWYSTGEFWCHDICLHTRPDWWKEFFGGTDKAHEHVLWNIERLFKRRFLDLKDLLLK